MKIMDFAREWVEKKGLADKDADYDGAIGYLLLAMVGVFQSFGHSGMSFQATKEYFNQLLKDWEEQDK